MIINFQELAYSISHWLSYQNKIGREFMNSESSLKYPIADYLTNISQSINDIKLEEKHFLFDDRYVDVTLEEDKSLKYAFELKVAKYNTTQTKEKQRIFNDLLRLFFMSKLKKVNSYFIISGEHQEFISFFRSISMARGSYQVNPTSASITPPQGFYTKWFEFSTYIKTKKIIAIHREVDRDYKVIYEKFLKDYKLKIGVMPNLSLPNYIRTECVALTPIHQGAPLSHLVGIWKVY